MTARARCVSQSLASSSRVLSAILNRIQEDNLMAKLTKEQIAKLAEHADDDDKKALLDAWNITPMDDDVLETVKKMGLRLDKLEKKPETKPDTKSGGKGVFSWL